MTAQRFAGVPTLQACAAGTHVMGAGDPDAVAVTRVQQALADLGYLPRTGVDGIFGDHTGKAVTAFKTDEALSPTDPKVGPGTMAALDANFAAEPVDGDLPDPSTDGLEALVTQAVASATAWATAARDALRRFPALPVAGEAQDPERENLEASLIRNFHLARVPSEEYVVTDAIVPMVEALPRVLSMFTVRTFDRAQYLVRSGTYETSTAMPGMGFFVTPAFRNTLTDEDRAADVLQCATMFCFPLARVQGWPGTARYDALDLQTAVLNSVSWTSFCYEVSGRTAAFRPTPRWYP